MTFLEAAIEVLRREGRPLPAKRLAELAVHYNLLSVVGRDPEGMMVARLDDVIDRPHPNEAILRIRPGVYGLRAYPSRAAAEEAPASAPSEVAKGAPGEV